MSQDYYYFAASLPMLSFDERPFVTLAAFLEDCARLLSERDYEDLRKAMFGSEGIDAAHPAARRWQQFMHDFRNELAWFRATEANREPLFFIRGTRNVLPRVIDALAEAGKAANPLEAEKALDRVRWDMLDELEQGHYYDFVSILSYGLRLKIMERYQVMAREDTQAILDGFKQEAIQAG